MKKIIELSFLKGKEGWGLLALRLGLGIVFVYAGWSKFQSVGTVGFFTSIGIPLPNVAAPLIAGIELIGGMFLILGIFTRIAALLLSGVMAVAILVVHGPLIMKLIVENGDLLGDLKQFGLLGGTLALVLNGAGPFSCDSMLLRGKK